MTDSQRPRPRGRRIGRPPPAGSHARSRPVVDENGAMSDSQPPRLHDHAAHSASVEGSAHGGHGRHGWMMIVCCIPMLVIAAVLLAAGVLSVGFLIFAVLCTAMMVLMMRGMSHGGSGGG